MAVKACHKNPSLLVPSQSVFMLSVIYAEYQLCKVLFMLNVINKPFMLSVSYAECHGALPGINTLAY
jgi:hypothetical protein